MKDIVFYTISGGILDFTGTTYNPPPIVGSGFKRIYSDNIVPSQQWQLQSIFNGPVSVYSSSDTSFYNAKSTLDSKNSYVGVLDSLKIKIRNLSSNSVPISYSISSLRGWFNPINSNTNPISSFSEDSVYVYYTIPGGTTINTIDTVMVVLSINSNVIDTSYCTITCLGQLINPYEFTSIFITPNEVDLDLGAQQEFYAYGINANNDTIYINPIWSTTGGTINDTTGTYTASLVQGDYLVIANDTINNLADTAIVHILHPTRIENEEYNPQFFELKQNYPNPFSKLTVISYYLPVASKVNLIIYDIYGKYVTTLVNENQKEGYYNIHFDSNELANGIYFYKLTTENFTEMKKMIIHK